MHRSVKETALLGSGSSAAGDPEVIAAETIAAISTPAGEGAIALVRISGPNAISIGGKIFRGKEAPAKFASRLQHLGEVVSESGNLIDQVMMSIHRAPASDTAEHLVDVSCRAGP